MSNMHRLIWFDKQIRASVYPNRESLADKFEISVRQAQRDIDYLKNSLEAPIGYDAKKRGYYYEDESYMLPNVYITDLQRRMLKFLAYRYENYTQTPKVAQMSELFKKLADEDSIDDEIPIFDLGKTVVQIYYEIYNAINSRNKLRMIYKDPYRGNREVKLDPYKLFFKYNVDHLVGYDNELWEFRVLRLDRIVELETLAESFIVSRRFEENKYSGFVEKEPFIAKVPLAGGAQAESECAAVARQQLEDIELIKESRAYIDCLYSVLTAAGKYKGPKYLLSGMTGFAFIFSAHKELIVASTEMYGLRTMALNSLDILGYYTEVYSGLKSWPTFPLHQKRAVIRAKESIDAGMGVIVWAPGITDFGVIFGYDDGDEVFFYKDRHHKDAQILPYNNLGRAEASFWMCQIIGDNVEKDIRDVYLDSLEYAVDIWETPYIDEVIHNRALASGRKAYEYLIGGMRSGDFYELGAAKLIYYNAIAREEAYRYMNDVKEELPESYPAYLKYKELYDIYQRAKSILPPPPVPGQPFNLDRGRLPQLIEYCEEAKEAEEAAVSELKQLLNERLSNRYVDILDVKKFK